MFREFINFRQKRILIINKLLINLVFLLYINHSKTNEKLRQKQILNPSYITGGNDDDIGDN